MDYEAELTSIKLGPFPNAIEMSYGHMLLPLGNRKD